MNIKCKNVLFLTLIDFNTIEEHGIYQDLLREFVRHGHRLYIISPIERKKKQDTHIIEDKNTTILKLKIGNIQKTGIIEKGISTVTIEPIFIYGIKKYFSEVRFDLILYSTPPITFCNAIKYVKKRDGARTYLLLKDIFPQNAVDIGMMRTTGIGGILYRFFRKKEKQLYAVSDRIGCMSQANVDYVLAHNPEVNSSGIEVCPNSIEITDKRIDEKTRVDVRQMYGLPINKCIFIYGGNLGKPQDIPFMINCIKAAQENENAFFIIVGDGTEFERINAFIKGTNPSNVKLLKRLPQDEYDNLTMACDVGLIFLDHRFTIPNFPSRLLSYMQASLPVLACTDSKSDIGKTIVEGGFGWWCESNDERNFTTLLKEVRHAELSAMGVRAQEYLKEHYLPIYCYETIMRE